MKSGVLVNQRKDIERVNKGGSGEVNMLGYLVDNYLPELSLSDVEANRHRECHRLPPLNQLPNLRFHLEIHSLDLKLFEGRDFDF